MITGQLLTTVRIHRLRFSPPVVSTSPRTGLKPLKGTSLAWIGRCSDTAGDDSGILGFPFSLR
jgi:hypothetical protein